MTCSELQPPTAKITHTSITPVLPKQNDFNGVIKFFKSDVGPFHCA